MPIHTVGHEPGFSIWIARLPEPDGPYGLRFEMSEGKGVLRVARPGVVIEPPARAVGTEFRLSAQQLQNSRFQHVWGRGAFRQTHVLHRIDADALRSALGALPPGHWVELAGEVEGGVYCLFLPEQDIPDEDEPLPLGEAGDEEDEDAGLPDVVLESVGADEDEEIGEDEEGGLEILAGEDEPPRERVHAPDPRRDRIQERLRELDPATPGPTLVPFGEGGRTGQTARPVQPIPAPAPKRAAPEDDPYALIEQLKAQLSEARRRNVEMERQMSILKARLDILEGRKLAPDWDLPVEGHEPGGPTQKISPGWRPMGRR